LFVRLVIVAIVAGVMLTFALPAFAQDEGGQEFCDWYWDYEFNPSGGLEYWCLDPQLGWWYSQSEDESFLVTSSPGAAAAALDEPVVSEERPEANEEPLVSEQGPPSRDVESEGVSDSPAAEDAAIEDAVPEDGVYEGAIPTPQTPDSTDERDESAPAESTPAESTPAESTPTEGTAATTRRMLGVGILALTLIVALLMAWRLPMRRNVGDSQAWGNPQQYYGNYAPAEAPPETARGPEGEPSGVAAVPLPEEALREPSVSSSSPAARGPMKTSWPKMTSWPKAALWLGPPLAENA
jgi:hypothetical protein